MRFQVVILGLFFLLISCTNQGDSKLERKIEQLDKELKTLQEKHDSIVSFLSQSQYAILDIDTQKYASIRSASGVVFTFIIRKIEPYIDGYKISLEIGNLTAAQFQELSFKVSYTNEPMDIHLQELNFQEQSSPKRFPSNTWTNVDIILRSVNISQFKYIVISDLRTHVISMR